MKKVFILVLALSILAAVAAPSFAQGRGCRRNYDSRAYDSQAYYDNSRAYYDYSNQYRGRGFWDKHRDKATVAGGAVGGAILGGLIGGGRGAAIGALTGAGASALYTYKLRNRRYRY
jgi:hypothetical protein